MTRRTFVAAAAATTAAAAPARLPIQKGVIIEMVQPRSLSYAERFKIARDAGFEVVECYTTPDERTAEEIKKASEATGLPITSVMNQAHWKFPLSSADPAVVAESVKGMETSLRNAHFWGADAVLLVPAVVNEETRYQDAWTRSIVQVNKLLKLAEQLKVVITVENVGNRFLLSPLEFANYVDHFKSPWLRAYFDVGNVTSIGYPQDWIRTLGKRIMKLHLKALDPPAPGQQEGRPRRIPVNWKEVYRALAEIGYRGPATVELRGGDLEYLRKISSRVDEILTGVA